MSETDPTPEVSAEDWPLIEQMLYVLYRDTYKAMYPNGYTGQDIKDLKRMYVWARTWANAEYARGKKDGQERMRAKAARLADIFGEPDLAARIDILELEE